MERNYGNWKQRLDLDAFAIDDLHQRHRIDDLDNWAAGDLR